MDNIRDNSKGRQLIEEFKRKMQEDILKLLKDGEIEDEIAKILGVSDAVIYARIKEMNPKEVEVAKQEGSRKRKQLKEEEKNEKKRQRNETILELLREGKIQIKIAEIMGVTSATINKWIKQIDSEKVDEAKKQGDERILKLNQEGKTIEEIAEIMGVSVATISIKLKQMKAKPNYSQLKQKLKDHTITRSEIDDYRKYLDSKYDKIELKEVILMSNIYIKTKRTSEAIKFLNSLIGNEDMEYLGKERLIEARNETERIGKIQRVRELVKNNKSISEIIADTGLKETEIVKIRNQMQGDIER